MKNILKIITVLMLFTLVNGCQKEIDFEGNLSHESIPFIEGILYPEEVAKIYFSNSVSFFNEKVSPQDIFARGAAVEIMNNGETDILVADSTFDHFRCRWQPYYRGNTIIQHGETYHLNILYEGKEYMASTTIDQAQVNLDEVEYTPEFFDIYGGHDGVILRFQDVANSENYYRFQMDRWIDNSVNHAHVLEVVSSDCNEEGELYFVRDLGRSIMGDASIDGEAMEFYAEVSFEYSQGDSTSIYLQSLDARSAAFYQELDNQLQSIQNPFVEPTFIHSGIEGAFGVFGSVVRSERVDFVYPQDNP